MEFNFYLNQDDNDILEWEDLVPFDPTNSYDYDTPQLKYWKNAYWSVRWRFRNNEIFAFVGINNCLNLPDDWVLKYKYSFGLCPISGDPSLIEWTDTLHHTFTKPAMDYEDYSTARFPSISFILQNSDKYVTQDNRLILKCRLEAVPIPFAIRQGYDSRKTTGMVGLDNLGATCYLNALLQMLYHVNSFRKGVYEIPFENEVIQQSTTLALQSVFSRLQTDKSSVSTRDLTRAFGWNTSEAFQQQDVQEMMRILLDKLEERMKGTPADGTVQRLFVGKIKSYIRCLNIDFESSREEDFYDLQLDVKGCKDIYESFSRYVAKETLNGENQYDAGENRGKQDAEKGVLFLQLPPVLTIHLKRFEFDMQRMGFAKIHDRYEFPLRLDLNNYVQSTNEENSNISNIYHLHSVLVHSGDVSGGHYIAFIRPSLDDFWSMKDCHSSGSWYKFDDDIVTPADRREAVQLCFGSGHTSRNITKVYDYSSAYMLVYIRETEAPQIMETVEIPKQLSSRLYEERMKKQEEMMRHNHREKFFDIEYFVENDIAQFSTYSESEDLLSEKISIKHLKILEHCTYLGLIYAFASHFQRLPCEIEIWKASRKGGRLRIDQPIIKEDYNKLIVARENSFFVRFVEENDTDVLSEATELLELQSELIDAIRQRYISRIPNIHLTYDPCEGCTIGQGGYILHNMTIALQSEIPTNDVESSSGLIDRFQNLCLQAIENLSRSENCLKPTDMMIIFRAYDYEVTWQSLGIEKPISQVKRVKDEEDTESSDDSESDEDTDVDEYSANRKTRRLVYLGCMKLQSTSLYKDIELQFQHLLSQLFQTIHLQFPDRWKHIQFVNVDTDSEVITYPRKFSTNLKELDIRSGDILYCVPLNLDDDQTDSIPEDIMEELFTSNPYIDDIRNFFENETTKIDVKIKFHKSYMYPDILNRVTGLWKLARIPHHNVLMTETIISLSKRKRLCDLIGQLEQHFGIENEDRLLIGKTFLNQNGKTIYRQFRQQREKTLQDFCTGKNVKYILQIVLLPFSIDEKSFRNFRFLEFILCDKRMVSIRNQWLEKLIYPQATQRYRKQIGQLIDNNPTFPLDGLNRSHLNAVSDDLHWPNHITSVPDEWVFEDKLYLKFENSDDVSISEVIESIHDNIQGSADRSHFSQKRRLSKTASDSENSDQESDAEISRKRVRNYEIDASKQFTSRGDFSIPLSASQENDFEEVPSSDEVESKNPFLFADCPWRLIHLTQPVDLSSTDETNWGGPYYLIFEIDDHKVGKLFDPKTTAATLPQSWMEYFYEDETEEYSCLGVQAFSCDEWVFMCGASLLRLGVRAIPISVYSYEINMMGVAESLDHDTKPFLTYLREDDTYQTLTDRIQLYTGENNWEKLALVSRMFRAYLLPIESPSQSDDGDGNPNMEFEEDDEKTDSWIHDGEMKSQDTQATIVTSQIWRMYEKYYPDYTSGNITNKTIPLLGLQRPSRHSRNATSQVRYRKQSGIKIRG